jgi:hypothetical protein
MPTALQGMVAVSSVAIRYQAISAHLWPTVSMSQPWICRMVIPSGTDAYAM